MCLILDTVVQKRFTLLQNIGQATPFPSARFIMGSGIVMMCPGSSFECPVPARGHCFMLFCWILLLSSCWAGESDAFL